MLSSRKSVINLYTSACDVYDHRVRFALAEKGLLYEVHLVDSPEKNLEFAAINPYGNLPTLVDRDLVVYHPNIILEYLDERFPHPPLLPVYPVMRTRLRLIVQRIDADFAPLLEHLSSDDPTLMKQASREMYNYFVQLLPMLSNTRYFLSDELTVLDCCLAPIVWRFPLWNIAFDRKLSVLKRYITSMAECPSFKMSLNDLEREIVHADTALMV